MGWVEELEGDIVGLDTAPLINYIEDRPIYASMVAPFFEALKDNKIQVVTSIVTLLEVLVHPIRNNDAELAERYREVIADSTGFAVFNVTRQIAEEAARLRAFYNLRTPDSIYMATAVVKGAKYFLTNDLRLPSLPGLTVLKLDELRTRPEYTEQNDNQ